MYLINPVTQAVTLGVDNTNVYGLGEGRLSLRLESKKQYNHGLFIGDFAHMPPSVCGLWPACKSNLLRRGLLERHKAPGG